MRWLLLIVLAGCQISGAFVCDDDMQCRSSAGQGTCEPTGFCTFFDGDCATGKRYADNAGGGLAGTCAGGTTMTDAAMIDASFDPDTCPTGFDLTHAMLRARYAIVAIAGDYSVGATHCLQRMPGVTHPANITTMAKALALADLVPDVNGLAVGALQDPAAATDTAGWIHFDGSVVDPTLWVQDAPDDVDGVENGQQQAALLTPDGALEDFTATGDKRLLCECDGVPPALLAMTYLMDNDW